MAAAPALGNQDARLSSQQGGRSLCFFMDIFCWYSFKSIVLTSTSRVVVAVDHSLLVQVFGGCMAFQSYGALISTGCGPVASCDSIVIHLLLLLSGHVGVWVICKKLPLEGQEGILTSAFKKSKLLENFQLRSIGLGYVFPGKNILCGTTSYQSLVQHDDLVKVVIC